MEKSEVLDVAENTDGKYVLFITYEEGDIASATGNLYRMPHVDRLGSATPVQVLACSDTLRNLWLSPEGHPWLASADGFVGTTAPVTWPQATNTHYLARNGSPPWSPTALPRLAADGMRPNVTALWGTSDNNVFAGTYGGHIYHWDGKAWQQTHDAGPEYTSTILDFGGTGPDDVYAVGSRRTLLHFDGMVWTPLRAPAGPDNESFTAVAPLADGTVLISASRDGGRLLHGTAAGLTEFGSYPMSLVDMAMLGDRVLFATSEGVGELFGKDVQIIKANFKTSSMSAGLGRIYVIEPAQPVPAFINHDPNGSDGTWWRTTF